MSTKSSASNSVLLLLGDRIVARFEAKETEGKTTPAMTQAKAFLSAIMEDSQHELYAPLMAGELERVNSHVKAVALNSKPVLDL
jgi:hypothetical protein